MKIVNYRDGFIRACKRHKIDPRDVYRAAKLAPSSHYRAITKQQVEMSYATAMKLMRALDEITGHAADSSRAG